MPLTSVVGVEGREDMLGYYLCEEGMKESGSGESRVGGKEGLAVEVFVNFFLRCKGGAL